MHGLYPIRNQPYSICRSFTSSSGRLRCTALLFIFSLSWQIRVQIGAALAKAAAARFLQDSVDDGLPIRVLYEHKLASQAPDIPDHCFSHTFSKLSKTKLAKKSVEIRCLTSNGLQLFSSSTLVKKSVEICCSIPSYFANCSTVACWISSRNACLVLFLK